MPFIIDSPAFADGDPIPRKYTQDGENLSPPLQWRDPPAGTRSFVLLLDDSDAPPNPFRHWAVYDVPADATALPEGAGSSDQRALPHGTNGFGHRRYDGPAPPAGEGRHNYRFHLAALDVSRLNLSGTPSAAAIWAAAQPHVIGGAELVGTYERHVGAAHEQARRRPDKGEPVIAAGDAGGPNDGRNITTADLDRDAGKPRPNRLETGAYAADKPGSGSAKD